MINLKQYLNSLNEGLLRALSFDDELPDTLEVNMHKVSNTLDNNYRQIVETAKLAYKSFDSGNFTSNDIKCAIQAYTEYKMKYTFKYGDPEVFSGFIASLLNTAKDNKLNLNWIEFPNLTSLEWIFYGFTEDEDEDKVLHQFNGDISEWDVSYITNMGSLFKDTEFNGDLSKWDVSNVTIMTSMFNGSSFNNDSICNWDVSSVKDMWGMFNSDTQFNLDLSNWKLNSASNCELMLYNTSADFDLSKWRIHDRRCNIYRMYDKTPMEDTYLSEIRFYDVMEDR